MNSFKKKKEKKKFMTFYNVFIQKSLNNKSNVKVVYRLG